MSITLDRKTDEELAILTAITKALSPTAAKISMASVAKDSITQALARAEQANPKLAKQVRQQVNRKGS